MLTPATTRPRVRASEAGQSIVEFVFVLPFVLVLLFGIIDFGIAANNASDLNHVAASTARRLAVNADATFDPTAYARALAEKSVADNPTLAIAYSLPGGRTPSADAAICVKVTMTRTIHVIPGFSVGPTLNMSGKAAMRLETPATFQGADAAVGTNAACTS